MAKDVGETGSTKQPKDALKDIELRYRSLFDESPVAMLEEDFSEVKKFIDKFKATEMTDLREYLVTHPDEVLKCIEKVQILNVNRAFLSMYGTENMNQVTGSLSKTFEKDGLSVFVEEVLALVEGCIPFESKVSRLTVQGKKKALIFRINVPHGYEDSWSKVIVSMLDVTALHEARASAEFFTDILVHDLGNIHQGVLGSLELLLSGSTLDAHTEELANRALSQVMRSMALVNSVRRFSQIRKTPFTIEKTKIYSIYLRAVKMVRSEFPKKTLTITTNLSNKSPAVLCNEFIFDVFYNLIQNAAKHSKSDSLEISVMGHLLKGEEMFELRFIDKGSGMPDELKTMLSSPFFEMSQRLSGMGFKLVRQIIDQCSGSISIRDRVEKDSTQGTEIVVLIPLAK